MPDRAEGDEQEEYEEDPDPLRLIGQSLRGKYAVTRLIGQGGMGVVYEATHLRLDRRCALKFIKLGSTRYPQKVLERFLREARIGAHLQHPGIVEVFDVEEHTDGSPYIVMEFLEGQSLGERQRDVGAMDWREVLDVAARATIALSAAHARGIIHRDLKPDNVFLCADGNVKVLDFGIAHFEDDKAITMTGNVMGTPHYMSREQISCAKDIDGRADVYSFGVMLYRCISGQQIFETSNYIELLVKLASETPPDILTHVPSLPTDVAQIIRKAMAAERADRYQSMDELRGEIEESLSAAGVPFKAHASERTYNSETGRRRAAPPSETSRAPRRTPTPMQMTPRPKTLSLSDDERGSSPSLPSAADPGTGGRNPFDESLASLGATRAPSFVDSPGPTPARRWPLLVIGALVLAALAVGGALLSRMKGAPTPTVTSRVIPPGAPAGKPAEAAAPATISAPAAIVAPTSPPAAIVAPTAEAPLHVDESAAGAKHHRGSQPARDRNGSSNASASAPATVVAPSAAKPTTPTTPPAGKDKGVSVPGYKDVD